MNIQQSSIAGASRARETRRARRSGGFTLIELMVVLAIMAIVTSITVGAFRSLTDNNQRTACQANLSQVYQGLRLYMADEAGQAPLYNPGTTGATDPDRNIGLWNLWTFPEKGKEYNIAPVGTAPTARYLRSSKVLHCPSDTDSGAVRTNIELYTDATKQAYNPDYLSYQMYATDGSTGKDNTYSASDTADQIIASKNSEAQTYLPVRYTAATDPQFKRQLRQPITPTPAPPALPYYTRPPLDSTIVTWCRHHRFARDYDNVLFFDGSVQLTPTHQDEFKPDSCDTTGVVLNGANRVPRRRECD